MGLEFSDPYAPLPAGLPVPVDDRACRHLVGMRLPAITLQSSNNSAVDLSQIAFRERTVLFFFPAAGRPGVPDPTGWSLIPGARGCTPQLCDYRDATSEFQKRGIRLFGVSSQRHEDLVEIGQRNRLSTNYLAMKSYGSQKLYTSQLSRYNLLFDWFLQSVSDGSVSSLARAESRKSSIQYSRPTRTRARYSPTSKNPEPCDSYHFSSDIYY